MISGFQVGLANGAAQRETQSRKEREHDHCDLAASLLESHIPVRQPSLYSTPPQPRACGPGMLTAPHAC